MYTLIRQSGLLMLLITIISCGDSNHTKTEIPLTAREFVFTGNYTDDGYTKRQEGYDWVAVAITANTDSSWHVAIRSRADKKKPTCRFDADLVKINKETLSTTIDGKKILFHFTDTSLSIVTEKEEDVNLLNFYCSGGASLAGNYHKISEALDTMQIDKKVFSKLLSLQNISFDIWSTGVSGGQELYIQPIGLSIDNHLIQIGINGVITNAEIEDLNSDGYPEVLIYTRSAENEHIGNVLGVSVNNGKSASLISFPEKDTKSKPFSGYCGNDIFTIIENRLVQRFRVCMPGDKKNQPTGNYRQISYRLINGEASRKFVIDKVTEIAAIL